MKNIFKLIAIISILSLAACSTFNNPQRGYFDQRKISDNIFQVMAFNNKSNSIELMKTAAMYSAARITIEQGKKRFIILNEDFKTTKKLKIDWDDESEIDKIKEDGYIVIDEGNENIKTNIKSILLIELINEKDPRYSDAHDAAKLLKQLKPIIFPEREVGGETG
ncbi:MAG: hypothetical protein L3J15_00400 [Devosiaceae bacterium]|nr:hypothetical protein [Devosiaceae bacterium]